MYRVLAENKAVRETSSAATSTGWMVAEPETAGLAGRLIEESCLKHGVQLRVLTLDSERGISHDGQVHGTGMAGSACSPPEQVHFGGAPEVIRQRRDVLAVAYAARPDRFVAGPPRAAELSAEVRINRPLLVSAVDGKMHAAEGRDSDGKEGSLN